MIDYHFPAWAKTYVDAVAKALGDAYAEPAKDVVPYANLHGYLGGSLLPVMTYALLHQAREETLDAVSNVDKEKGEPSDVVDRADFFASALGEFAALLKIFTTMELDGIADEALQGEEQALKEDWEKLADDMQALAAIIQSATEEFEDALDAADRVVEEARRGATLG